MAISATQIVRIAALSALAIAATVTTKVPFYGTILHLGSIIVITSALLFGPIEGSIISGMSMGLYDIFFYNPASAPKTSVSYFLFGLIVGFIAYQDKYIKNTILRYVLAILIGGSVHTASYFIFNAYIINGGLAYAQVRIVSSVITVAATFVTIPITLVLSKYTRHLTK